MSRFSYSPIDPLKRHKLEEMEDQPKKNIIIQVNKPNFTMQNERIIMRWNGKEHKFLISLGWIRRKREGENNLPTYQIYSSPIMEENKERSVHSYHNIWYTNDLNHLYFSIHAPSPFHTFISTFLPIQPQNFLFILLSLTFSIPLPFSSPRPIQAQHKSFKNVIFLSLNKQNNYQY